MKNVASFQRYEIKIRNSPSREPARSPKGRSKVNTHGEIGIRILSDIKAAKLDEKSLFPRALRKNYGVFQISFVGNNFFLALTN